MRIDITLEVTPQMRLDAQGKDTKALSGHLGTHFDVMDKTFPLEYLERKAVVFDVSHVKEREIEAADIDLNEVHAGMFIVFHTGFIEEAGYGTERYHHAHPQLSHALLEELVKRRISIIGIDFAGVRRGREHTPADQYCADHGVFVVENLCGLGALPKTCTIYTFPVRYAGMSGLPCRVIAETEADV